MAWNCAGKTPRRMRNGFARDPIRNHPRRVMTAAVLQASLKLLTRKMSIMPLHERETVNEQLADCVFVGRDMTRPVPKYRFPRDETLPREAFQVVSDELILDGNARTWPRSARRGPSRSYLP